MAMRPLAVSGAPLEQLDLQLAQWSSSIYQLERRAAVEAGFTLGSVSLQGDYRLLVIYVARTAVKEIAAKRRSETWGYGYRLLVEISDIEGMGSLNLPAIAAKVGLGEVEASVRLQVNGFVGPELWKELPVPRPLDVDTYKDYIAAAGRIQTAFTEHPDQAVPVKLAEDDDSMIAEGGVNQVEMREAVVLVGLLQRASDKVPQEQAAASLASVCDLPEGVIDRLAGSTYAALGIASDQESVRRGAELAAALLRPLD